jgi:hypothetical protein
MQTSISWHYFVPQVKAPEEEQEGSTLRGLDVGYPVKRSTDPDVLSDLNLYREPSYPM